MINVPMIDLPELTEDYAHRLLTTLRQLPIYHSKTFLNSIRKEFPDKDPHHLIGSMGSLKLNDYMLIPLSRGEHQKADKARAIWLLKSLPGSLNLLFNHIRQGGK